MADFADDALAGVRLLQSRPDIDAGKIGLFGHSQGGWQAPLAAVRSNGGVAFVVTAAGPAKDYRSQTNDEIANMIRFAGLGRAAAAAAIAHQDLYWGVMRHQVAWPLLAASSDSARTKPWGRFVWKPRAEPDVLGDTLEYIEPEPVLTRLTQPILAMYGAHDIRVNGTENARLMRAFLARAGNRSAEVRTFQNADHDFWIARKKTIKDVSGTTGYVSRYLSTVVEWIRAQATKP